MKPIKTTLLALLSLPLGTLSYAANISTTTGLDANTPFIEVVRQLDLGNVHVTLVAPTLGVATATTINKVTITAPATGSTLTIADGKTFTVNQTLTLTGTTGTTMTFPASSATIARTDAANTFTGASTTTSWIETSPVITTGLTASGSASNDFSGSTGTFKTSTGANTIGGAATFPAGTATAGTAPIYLTSGTSLTAAAAGAVEYDGVAKYFTANTSEGRSFEPNEQFFRLTSNGSTISTIANFFGTTSNITIVSGGFYEIDIYAFFLNTTSGTVVWTLTNSAAPTSQNIVYEASPATGVVAPPGTATMLSGQVINDATATLVLTATSALTDAVNHYTHMHIFLKNGTGTSLKIQATKSAGSITPLVGSYWTCKRLPASSTGTFSN